MLRQILSIIVITSLSACVTTKPANDFGWVAPLPDVDNMQSVANLINEKNLIENDFVDKDLSEQEAVLVEPEQTEEHVASTDEENTELDQTDNLWLDIQSGYNLPPSDHARVVQQRNWYVKHPEYIRRVTERAGPYLFYVVQILEENDIPLEIALLPIVESAYKPFAYSHGRASGMWQFIPSTGRRFGLKQNWWYDGRRDVYASTIAAVKLLKVLHKNFDGDWMLALAAYNSGGGNVRKAIRYNKKRGLPTDFFSLRLPKETKYYVPKLLALRDIFADPESYGIELSYVPNKAHFKKVELDSQIDLALAAELADITIENLYQLNPGYNRWATSPTGPYYLLLPIEKVELFEKNIAEFPAKKRVRWIRHKIRKGDTLSAIATKYNTSIKVIKRVNRIRGTQLRAGHHLTIPVASKNPSAYKYSANQRKSKKQNVKRKGKKITHIVRQGDTLWDLSRKHNIGVRQLAKWNSMAPRDPLVPGQTLIIWSRRASASSSQDLSYIDRPPSRKLTQRIGYRVRNGDSLFRISKKFNVSISQLRRWNKLPKGKVLQPGQRIYLYVNVMQTSS